MNLRRSHLGVLADLLVHGVNGRLLEVCDVHRDLGHIGLLQVPAYSLDMLQAARLKSQHVKMVSFMSYLDLVLLFCFYYKKLNLVK